MYMNNILTDYDYQYPFMNGFAAVELNDKWNFIKTDGQLLFKQWFDEVGSFNVGLCVVRLDNKWNCINSEGQLLFHQWFDQVKKIN